MLIKIKVLDLINVIKKLSNFVEKKKTKSIFSYILIKKIDKKILYTVINNETEITIVDDISYNKCKKNIEIIMNFSILHNLCKRNKKETFIFIKKNSSSIEIKIKNVYTKLSLVSEIFPKFDFEKNINILKLNSDLFKNILLNTINILNKNILSLDFVGSFIEINKNIITGMAVDNFGFVYANEYCNFYNKKYASIIFSREITKYIIKFIDEETTTVYIFITENFIKIIIKNIIIITKIITENFFIPELSLADDISNKIIIKKNKIKNLLNKISLIAKNKSLYFFFYKKYIKIIARNKKERAYIVLKENTNIKKYFRTEVKFEYFADIIKTINNDNITILFSKKKKYIIIKGLDNNHIHVLMHK